MKNKLILMLLMLTGSIYAEDQPQHYTYLYKNVSEKLLNVDSACVQAVLICSSWAAKFDLYNFIEFESDNCKTFIAYNFDCNFSIRIYKDTCEVSVEFEATDDSFDFDKFIMNVDSFFLTL
jgi:hypothetical protein